ncbi:MAG: coproporphyrinogen dehydrogenase HemZ [Firmicutes bacterium]|nr:coproporphyrinogen dehydrogenase HemZ [Bacillota bacterium]
MKQFSLCVDERHFYELSTLVREFFPLCTVLSEKQDGCPGISLSGTNPDIVSGLLFDENGRKILSLSVTDPFDDFQGERWKNLAKICIFRLLTEAQAPWGSKKPLPWGILTGVRPSKIAYAYLEEGKQPYEIVSILKDHYLLREDKAALSAKVAFSERRLMASQNGNDISIYVGIPFCPTRCSYCSFISSDARSFRKYSEDYLKMLIREIRAGGEMLKNLPGEGKIRSLYMGGGTPTTLSEEQLRILLEECENAFYLSDLLEVTVEAGRPDTITREKLMALKEAGVGRISINPQTMVQATLDRIGRHHTTEQVEEAFHLAREIGGFIINMDLILGLPGEGLEDVIHTLNKVKELKPDNLTVHTLAVKRSSRMNEVGDGERLLMEDPEKMADQIDEMITLSAKTAAELGLYPYYMYRQKNMAGNFENVGYSLPGKEGLYNIEIMEERQSIIAFGAGGVSKIYTPDINRIERVPNVKGVEEYIRRIDEMIQRKKEGLKTHA